MEKNNVIKRLIEAIKKGWARLGEEDVSEPATIEGLPGTDSKVLEDIEKQYGGRTPGRSRILRVELDRRKEAAGYGKPGPTRSGRSAKSGGREIDD